MKRLIVTILSVLSIVNTSFAFDSPPRVWFVPNQLAANKWYKIDSVGGPTSASSGQVVNGHINDGFGVFGNWGNLSSLLAANKGGFAIYAAEMHWIPKSFYSSMSGVGLPMQVEMPAMTQCLDGWAIGAMEFKGTDPSGVPSNVFSWLFKQDPSDISYFKNGRGWFSSSDNLDYKPYEIVLDERILPLSRVYDPQRMIDNDVPGKTWEQIKQAAAGSTYALCNPSFNGDASTLAKRDFGYVMDYVEYSRVLRQRWSSPPKLAIHWNINPGWEWSDEQTIDSLYQADGSHSATPSAKGSASKVAGWLAQLGGGPASIPLPSSRDLDLLNGVINNLCADGICPSAIYFDVDFTYNSSYSLRKLRDYKALLAQQNSNNHPVAFGVNIVDACEGGGFSSVTDYENCAIGPSDQSWSDLKRVNVYGRAKNIPTQESLLNTLNFLVRNGIVDGHTNLRITSWGNRPQEVGSQVSESVQGSFAQTATRLINEILIPNNIVP